MAARRQVPTNKSNQKKTHKRSKQKIDRKKLSKKQLELIEEKKRDELNKYYFESEEQDSDSQLLQEVEQEEPINISQDESVSGLLNQFNQIRINDQQKNSEDAQSEVEITNRLQGKKFEIIYELTTIQKQDIVDKLKETFQRQLSGYIIFGYLTRNQKNFYVYIEFSQKQYIRKRNILQIRDCLPLIQQVNEPLSKIFLKYFKNDEDPIIQGIKLNEIIKDFERYKKISRLEKQIIAYLKQKDLNILKGKQFILTYKDLKQTREQISCALEQMMKNNIKIIAVALEYNESTVYCFIELEKPIFTGNENYFDIFQVNGLYHNQDEDIEMILSKILMIDQQALIKGVNQYVIDQFMDQIYQAQIELLPKQLIYYLNTQALTLKLNYTLNERNYYIWSNQGLYGKTTFCKQALQMPFISEFIQNVQFQDQIKPYTKVLLIDNFDPERFHNYLNMIDGYYEFKRSDQTKFKLSKIILIILAYTSPLYAFGEQNYERFYRKFQEINLEEQSEPFQLENDKINLYNHDVQPQKVRSNRYSFGLSNMKQWSEDKGIQNQFPGTFSSIKKKSYLEDEQSDKKFVKRLQNQMQPQQRNFQTEEESESDKGMQKKIAEMNIIQKKYILQIQNIKIKIKIEKKYEIF